MMKIINNSDSVIILLYEMYGINKHIQMICKKLSKNGYDIICPNLINGIHAFNYDAQDEAYQYFMNNVGLKKGTIAI